MKKKQLCVICGKNIATTRDHIPPKSIFPKPRPDDLITVPACSTCNNGDSDFDERFKVYSNLHVLRNEKNWEELFESTIAPTINHNKRLKKDILAGAKDVMLETKSGNKLGHHIAIKWDSEAFVNVIERTTRGLHWHHTNEILGNRAKIEAKFLDSLESSVDVFKKYPLYSIGNGLFLYKYLHSNELKYNSVWIYQFRGALWAGAVVEPIRKKGANAPY